MYRRSNFEHKLGLDGIRTTNIVCNPSFGIPTDINGEIHGIDAEHGEGNCSPRGL